MEQFTDILHETTADRTAATYLKLNMIRQFESRLLDLFSAGELTGTTHTCIGQEANAVALMDALDREIDTIWSNHRCHGHFLAYCGDAYRLFAEILGRTSGVCSGRGGSQHLAYRNFFSSGIQGGLVPLAVGTALADKDKGAITTVFLGDGTMGQGYVYEALNLAALWDCPILFVVEDNGIAQTTPRTLGVSGEVGRRADPFGIESRTIRSVDVDELSEAADAAVNYVRSEMKPFWLHIETVRLRAHSKGDDTRPEAELTELRKCDCVELFARRLGNATEAYDAIVKSYLDECFEAAIADPQSCA